MNLLIILAALTATDPREQAAELLLRTGALLCDSKQRAERVTALLELIEDE